MTQKKRRNKSQPTTGDILHQQYRNRAAMRRVYDAAIRYNSAVTLSYWTPANMDQVV